MMQKLAKPIIYKKKGIIRNENYRPIYLTNVDEKSFNRMLANITKIIIPHK